MFRFPQGRIRRQVTHWRTLAQASQCPPMVGEPTSVSTDSSGSGTSAHQVLQFQESDDGVSVSAFPGAFALQPVEFLSRATSPTPRAQTNVVARSSLSHYMELMYKIGICPHAEYQVTRSRRWRKSRKICYSVIAVLSVFYIIRTVKFEVMTFLGKKGHIGRMMGAIFIGVYGIHTMCLMHFLAFRWGVVVESLRSLNFADSMYLNRTRKQVNQDNKRIGRGVFVISVLLVTVLAISGFHRFGEWSLRDFVGFESYYIRSTFTVWRPKHWSNGTAELWADYGEDASPTSIILAILGGISSSFGWLQEHLVLDLLLLLTVGLSGHMSKLMEIIQDKNASLDTKWEEYEKLRKVSGKINTAFRFFLPLAHLNNLFLFSYFLLAGFLKVWFVYILLLGAKTGKILLTYYVASVTAHKNKALQAWVTSVCAEEGPVIIKGKKMKVPVMLSIAYNDLIGLGQDDFFISQKFLVMFIGTVGTVFLLLVDWNEDKDLCDCTNIAT